MEKNNDFLSNVFLDEDSGYGESGVQTYFVIDVADLGIGDYFASRNHIKREPGMLRIIRCELASRQSPPTSATYVCRRFVAKQTLHSA